MALGRTVSGRVTGTETWRWGRGTGDLGRGSTLQHPWTERSEAGWGGASVCTGGGASGAPQGGPHAIARPGSSGRGAHPQLQGPGGALHWDNLALAESQPMGPRGGLGQRAGGPGSGRPKCPQRIDQNARPRPSAPVVPPPHGHLPEKRGPKMHCTCGENVRRGPCEPCGRAAGQAALSCRDGRGGRSAQGGSGPALPPPRKS